jgi:hypothetical protein
MTDRPIQSESSHGRVNLDCGLNDTFNFYAEDLAIVAEYCLPANSQRWGHYWLVILSDGRYCEWPTEIPASPRAVKTLEEVVGEHLIPHLSASNIPSSNVMWPKHLKGLQAVIIKTDTTSIFSRIAGDLIEPRFTMYWSDVVVAEIERLKANHRMDS